MHDPNHTPRWVLLADSLTFETLRTKVYLPFVSIKGCAPVWSRSPFRTLPIQVEESKALLRAANDD